ncbi:unnamed protein product [Coregonus sp. 'balchen']|nr:unnamed protein product [Coregonus sp. 'balchen']
MRPMLRKVVLIALLGRDQPRRKGRSVSVQGWLMSRKQAGEFHHLIQDLRLFGEEFLSYFSLDQSQFDHLLQMVGARIARMDTNYRESISPVERLAICLWPRVLHNYLRRAFQEPLRMEMGTPNGHLPDVTRAGANNAPRQALQVREKLTTYFSSPAGEVPWQHAME